MRCSLRGYDPDQVQRVSLYNKSDLSPSIYGHPDKLFKL